MFFRSKSLTSTSPRRGVFRSTEQPIPVADGLSLTPSQMQQMSEHGIPIASNMNPDLYDDGDTSLSVHVLPENLRGIDVAALWELDKTSRVKLRNAESQDIATYGSQSSCG